MAEKQEVSLSEAVKMFIASLSPEERHANQMELNNFARWYGGDRSIYKLTAKEIGSYGNNISAFDTNPMKKLEPVRTFLSFAHKKKLTNTEKSLAPSLRVNKSKQRRKSKQSQQEPTVINLTKEGYASLQTELEELIAQRPVIANQLRIAAADKDFRENAPLEAAREHQGKVEARIRELEATLNVASVMHDKRKSAKTVGVGCTVTLTEPETGDRLSYKLVSPSEAAPAQGKLSIASPVGKALLDKSAGTLVEVIAPAGKMRYKIEDISG